MNLTIRRHEWLRGEGGQASYLLRPSDRKLCCVGIYLRKLGIPLDQLDGARTADDVAPLYSSSLPEWLIEDPVNDDIGVLYSANDDVPTPPEARESNVRELFAKHDVIVKFVD